CDEPVNKVNSHRDLDALTACSKLSGSIVFGPTVTLIDFGDIEVIEGDIIVESNSNLRSIGGRYLHSIGGTFKLHALTSLASLSFPVLERIYRIDWVSLPTLTTLRVDYGINKCHELIISDTALFNLKGLDLQQIGVLYINNNRYLHHINLGLSYVNEGMDVSSNAKNLTLSMPNLVWAGNITLREVGTFQAPRLHVIKGSAAFVSNTFTNLHLNNLTTIAGSLSVISNPELQFVDFTNLVNLDGVLHFSKNPKLKDLGSFASLETIAGSIDISGSFNTYHFPALQDVRGAVSISSESEVDCKFWNDLHDKSVIKGGVLSCSP
ncbi:hypothetical protein CANCADRAFT_18009, partial [Tortispora caseinolytica NRRL Y-17796]